MKSISICCSPFKPDYQEFIPDERKVFCKLVYLLRKRGYSIADAQEKAYRKILEDSIPYDLGK